MSFLPLGTMSSTLKQSVAACANTYMIVDGESNPQFHSGEPGKTTYTAIQPPTTAPTLTASATTSELNGTYSVWYSYESKELGIESNLSPVATIAVSETGIDISNIILSSHPYVDNIKIFVSKDGELIPYWLTDLAHTGTPTYTRTETDSTLSVLHGFLDETGLIHYQPFGVPFMWTVVVEYRGYILAGGTHVINTGTATVTNGSTSVSISGLTLKESMAGMYISFAGNQTYYQISSVDVSGSTLTLTESAVEASDDYTPFIFGISQAMFISYKDANGKSHPYAFPFTWSRTNHYVETNKESGEEITGAEKLGGGTVIVATNLNTYVLVGDVPATMDLQCTLPGHGCFGHKAICKGPNGSVLMFDSMTYDVIQINGPSSYKVLFQNRIKKYMTNESGNNFNLSMDHLAELQYNPQTEEVLLWRAGYGDTQLTKHIVYSFRTDSVIVEDSRLSDMNVAKVEKDAEGFHVYTGDINGGVYEEDTGIGDDGNAVTMVIDKGFVDLTQAGG